METFMDLQIRRGTKEDLPAVLQIYAQPDLDGVSVLSVAEADNIFNKISEYPNYRIYVAEVQGQIAGTFALLIMDNLIHKGAPSGIVEAVAVLQEYQRKGIGKAMMHYARNLCRETRCCKLSLSSNLKRKHAHEFYRSLGFKEHGRSFYVEL
jgi:GNAT superfamily N-acetyltransferase